MLTRLKVNGFKNLLDVDLQFGLFTCVAGPNGAGKSNLFDAITFLSDLASMPIMKAASRVRGSHGRASDFEALFFRSATGQRRIELAVEMIVPRMVVDEFDRDAQPTATWLEYTLVLCLNDNKGSHGEPISIEHEELKAKSSSEAARHLSFDPPKELLRQFVFGPGKRTRPFIEMEPESNSLAEPVIVLAGDKGPGRSPKVPARKSPQTVLSGVNAVSHPTALAARREMQSWRLLQLEPSALRKPDEFRSDNKVSPTGEHLPNTLHRLARGPQVANRLAELLPDVREVGVESDDTRELRTLVVRLREPKPYTASSLSDGTLRFLALAVLATDVEATGLVCMEEPENGIHPLRVPEMLRLVRDLSDAEVDPGEYDGRNALRQVVINTHSPLVVGELDESELLMAETVRLGGGSFVRFRPLDKTWRAPADKKAPVISRGELMSYLSGIPPARAAGQRSVKLRAESEPATGDLFRG
jgi:predicted ATPase